MKKPAFLIASLFLMSCHSSIGVKGKIIDKHSQQPVENVSIISIGSDTVFSEAGGSFLLKETLFGMVPTDHLPLMFTKDNYKPVYREVDDNSPRDLLIEMEYTGTPFVPAISFKWVATLYNFQRYLYLGLFLLTYIILYFAKWMKRRYLWFLFVTFFHFSFFISCLDGSFTHFRFSVFPAFLIHYWTHPYTVMIIFPIGLIVLWGFYFMSRDAMYRVSTMQCVSTTIS